MILAIIKGILLTKLPGAQDRWELGRPDFLSTIARFVRQGKTVQMCLPAFPFKSVNKVEKVLGTFPDKAEELSLRRLNDICMSIGKIYPPGAELLIISDGLVYSDLFTTPDREVWAYGEALRALARERGFSCIRFSRLRDLVDVPHLPERLDEVTYVGNAFNFRRELMNLYADPAFDPDKAVEENEDVLLTYLGYTRFLKNDLRHIFPSGPGGSARQYKRNVKYIAKQMIIRGNAFAAAVKARFPHHLRLSIHQSVGEHKISINLLPTATTYTTPWHCAVAFRSDGTLISAPKIEFENDPDFELVYEDGRPSYFREVAKGPVEMPAV
ncbi:transferase family protein [Apiospora kogelbergensis]|uniref:Transferase family protein n=1 Tax=Apiospora kogelbergensis TaxID=1337665 RepID=A0AAW0QNN1_9PEZI